MSTSVLETVRAAFVDNLETIVAGETYRNTVQKVYEDFPPDIPDYPAITFMFGDGTLKTNDSGWTNYNLEIPFFIVCAISANTSVDASSNMIRAQDSLLHDIMRVVAILNKEHIVPTTGSAWYIANEPTVKFSPIFPTKDKNEGRFVVDGVVCIKNMTGSFDA